MIGAMDQRIIIERKPTAPTRGSTGQEVFTWVTVDTVWAEELQLSASEQMTAGMEQAQLLTKYRIRYRDDVTSKNRIRHGSRISNIRSVLREGRNRWLYLLCEEMTDVESS